MNTLEKILCNPNTDDLLRSSQQKVQHTNRTTILHKFIVLATDLLQQVLSSNRLQYIFLACLLQLATKHKLIQYEVCLFKIEDNVQLTHLGILKGAICQSLYVIV